jgi:hypothetical protein
MGRHNGAHFRKFHQQHGEQIRWWKAIIVPEGTAGRGREHKKFIEQTKDATARFLVSNSEMEVESEEFGLVKKGVTQISAFPRWARFNEGDRIVLL